MIRFLTAGESHGPKLTAMLDGIPAGLPLLPEDMDGDLARRQKGYGSGGRMSIEKDHVEISAGVMNGKTTGGPIALTVYNRDWANWKEKDITPLTTPRPGHADLTGAVKYGYGDLRLSLERASARETTMRVAVGGICKRFLAEFGIVVGGYVVQIGSVKADLPESMAYTARFLYSEDNDVRCPDAATAEAMHQEIRQAIIDTMVSIQAMKGAEIGPAFENAGKRGTQVQDEIILAEDGRSLTRRTNRAGGIEGGISTGEPILARVAMKPISTIVGGLESVDLASGESAPTTYERSDYCALPRAVPVGEAMMAIVLANALAEKLGGDSIAEMKPRFETLRRASLDDLPMDNLEWRFGYNA
jgi:chorismate synthase